jgi:AcrR family transcriptional regulator
VDTTHPDETLRARKKRRTREAVADAAAELFATHGYDAVTVADVARAADVSEQTVYNHFPTKEHLVFDRADEMISSLLDRVRGRDPGESALDTVRERGLQVADVLASLPPGPAHGGMPYLTATSPALARSLNDLYVRNAADLAAVLGAEQSRPADDLGVRVQALALLAPSHAFIQQLGRRLAAGESTADAARALRPGLEAAFARLRTGLGDA